MNLEKHNLIQLLRTLSNSEWKEFEKFTASPFFNKGRNYIPLLKILKKFHPSFESPEFTTENIYSKLYPEKKYKESVLNSMFSRLYIIGEEYLIQIALEKSKTNVKDTLIMTELRSRGVTLKVNSLVENSLVHFENKKFSSFDFENLKSLKEQVYFLHQINNEREKYDSASGEVMIYFIYHFITDILFMDSGARSNKIYWDSDYDKGYVAQILSNINFEEIMKLVKKNDPKNFLPINIYYLAYKASRFPENDDSYYELKDLFFKNMHKFEPDFKRLIIYDLWNNCISRNLMGKENFNRESFEIRKKIIEENLFPTISKYMRISEFRSSFISALNVGEFEWAENFSVNYLYLIHPKFRNDVSNFCKARIAYEKGSYDEALEYSGKVRFNQITFKLDIKNLLSKIYFETDSTEPLYSLLNTYYQLLNNAGSKDVNFILRHRNFVRHLKKLVDIKCNDYDSAELMFLKKNIQDDNVSNKSWLLKHVEKLIAS
ncbi:MAG: hypothetical protein SGI89_09230 [bacterium]|nr:hypothetical protein [bacterium]